MIYQPGLSIMNQLVARAASVTQFSIEELRGPGRTRAVAHIRFAVMRLAYAKGVSTTRIGRGLGGRDHTTILSGLRQAEALTADEDFAALLAEIDA